MNTPTDTRFSAGLINDVHKVLQTHGYQVPAEEEARYRALGDALLALYKLTQAFEGSRS